MLQPASNYQELVLLALVMVGLSSKNVNFKQMKDKETIK